MLKEYRTVREVVGPLMLVEKVTDANFEELVEIQLASGGGSGGDGSWRLIKIKP